MQEHCLVSCATMAPSVWFDLINSQPPYILCSNNYLDKFSSSTLCSNNYFDISIEAIQLISNTEFDTTTAPHIWNETADSFI